VIAAFEELRGRLHASFQQSQRFSADASHELRTPLTILRGHVEQAIAEAPTGSEGQIRLRVMEEEIGRLVDVTEKLLLLSRADAQAIHLQKVRIDFSDFLSELVSDATLFETDLRISAQIEPGIFWRCDALLIRQLVFNLYTNAVHYNITQGWIHFTATQSGAGLELTVENPTRHFSPELSQKAFDRFYRGNASRSRLGQDQGLGLGLSLCREIAHLHGGTLTLTGTATTSASSTEPYRVSALLHLPLTA
jgi:signal transduction histidine kinase